MLFYCTQNKSSFSHASHQPETMLTGCKYAKIKIIYITLQCDDGSTAFGLAQSRLVKFDIYVFFLHERR